MFQIGDWVTHPLMGDAIGVITKFRKDGEVAEVNRYLNIGTRFEGFGGYMLVDSERLEQAKDPTQS